MNGLLAESSDAVQIATMIVGLLGTIFTGVMAYKMVQLNRTMDLAEKKASSTVAGVFKVQQTLEGVQDAAASDLSSIKTTLKENAQSEGQKLDAIHVLVNGGLGETLVLSAETSRFKANALRKEGNMKEAALAEKAAQLAEKKLQEHIQNQKVVAQQITENMKAKS